VEIILGVLLFVTIFIFFVMLPDGNVIIDVEESVIKSDDYEQMKYIFMEAVIWLIDNKHVALKDFKKPGRWVRSFCPAEKGIYFYNGLGVPKIHLDTSTGRIFTKNNGSILTLREGAYYDDETD
jgi:hypothetical protein